MWRSGISQNHVSPKVVKAAARGGRNNIPAGSNEIDSQSTILIHSLLLKEIGEITCPLLDLIKMTLRYGEMLQHTLVG